MARDMKSLLEGIRERITRLERNARRAGSGGGGGGGLPFGSPIPFLGPDTAIPARHIRPEGQIVSRVTYAALFDVFGTMYGAGDGSTTFGLPDLRERTLVGVSAGSAEFGSVGAVFGTKTHTLTSAQIPNLSAASNGAHTHGVGGGYFVTTTRSADSAMRTAPTGTPASGSAGVPSYSYPTQTPTADAATSSGGAHTHTVNTGGGGAHNNIQPSMACLWLLRY